MDAEWQAKLAKADSRFKFGVIDYDNTDSQNRIMDLIQKFEQCLELPLIDRTIQTWRMFLGDMSILEIDRKSGKWYVDLQIDFDGVSTKDLQIVDYNVHQIRRLMSLLI